jgi:hypothetical protein
MRERKEEEKLKYSFAHRGSMMRKYRKSPTKLLNGITIILIADAIL